MTCIDFIWTTAWANQNLWCNFVKIFSEVPWAKEAWTWSFHCDYTVFGNGVVVDIGTFHSASNTYKPVFLNKMTTSLVQELLFLFPKLIKLCLVTWIGSRSESSRRFDLSKIESKWWDDLKFPSKEAILSKDMVMWTCSVSWEQNQALSVFPFFFAGLLFPLNLF